MYATLKRTWNLIEAGTGQRVLIPPGRYELVRINNPFGHEAKWLVIKGTKAGQTDCAWRQWTNGTLNGEGKTIDWGEFEIIIEN
jgi:hypothetical protein